MQTRQLRQNKINCCKLTQLLRRELDGWVFFPTPCRFRKKREYGQIKKFRMTTCIIK